MVSKQFALGFVTASSMVILMFPYLFIRWNKKKAELIENYTRFVTLVENTKDFLYYYQVYPSEKFLYLSPSTDNVLGEGMVIEGYTNPNACYMNIYPDDYDILCKKVRGEIDYSKSIIQRWKGKDGKYRWFEEYATPIYKDGILVAIQGVMRNIDEKIELQEKMQYRLHHDCLTNIYNREYFELTFTKYDEEINVPIAIVICDLDGLKYVNDTYGHKMGDKLIQEAARELNKFSSDHVIVSRLGGDEFVLIIADTTEDQLIELVFDIVKAVDHYNLNGSEVKMKMSIGYSFEPSSIGKMNQLLSQADKNMYIDKINRKKVLVGNLY